MKAGDPALFSANFSAEERSAAEVLVVDFDALDRESLSELLLDEGYGDAVEVPDFETAKKALTERAFTHVIFSHRDLGTAPEIFVANCLVTRPNIIPLVCAAKPDLNDVLNILVMGVRGFLVKPVTPESLTYAMAMASHGNPIPGAILEAEDRDKALFNLLADNLDRVAQAIRQLEGSIAVQQELPKLMAAFAQSAELALTFAKGGEPGFLGVLENFLIERSAEPATQLGRLRKRLAQQRMAKLS